MSLIKTISIQYVLENQIFNIKDVQLDHILDIFIPIKISSITSIRFYNNTLNSEDIEIICPLIPQKLISLDISRLGLYSPSIKILSKRLIYSHIKALDISYNPIGDESMWIFLDLITQNQDLITLRLVKCNLTGNGIWTLLNAISQRNNFELLDISENELMSLGADYIHQFLILDPFIHEIHANRCLFSGGDIGLLIDDVEKCSILKVFSAKGNAPTNYRKIPERIQVDTSPQIK